MMISHTNLCYFLVQKWCNPIKESTNEDNVLISSKYYYITTAKYFRWHEGMFENPFFHSTVIETENVSCEQE